jgi:hypothetical protein
MYVEWKDRRTGEIFRDQNGRPLIWEAWSGTFSTEVYQAKLTRTSAMLGTGGSGFAGLCCFALFVVPTQFRNRRLLALVSAWQKATAKPLYVNLWFENAQKRPLAQPIRMIAGSVYYFTFAIESQPRNYSLVKEVFKLTNDLKEVVTTNAIIEVICPFIAESCDGYAVRDIDFHRDLGIIPEKFVIKPDATGKFYLTSRLWIRGEIRYRAVLTVRVYRSKYGARWADLLEWLSGHATPLAQALKPVRRITKLRN